MRSSSRSTGAADKSKLGTDEMFGGVVNCPPEGAESLKSPDSQPGKKTHAARKTANVSSDAHFNAYFFMV
jgi:hypothetical protein